MPDDKPSAAELFAAFPQARAAVSWCEFFICEAEPGEPSIWETYFAGKNHSPASVLEALKRVIADEVSESLGGPAVARARAEMDTADFARYIAGKLGAM